MSGWSILLKKNRYWGQVLLKLRNDVTDTMVESIASSSVGIEYILPYSLTRNELGARKDEMR